MIKCKLCGHYFKFITAKHLAYRHNCTVKDYVKRFGDKNVGHFPFLVNKLNKSDPRYIKWKKSLKKRPSSWNKGFNKENHPAVKKISETFKEKKLDNFAKWRKDAIKRGLIRVDYPNLKKNGDLAELIGVVLGDGHIGKFPRTEVLEIYSNSNNHGFIERYSKLVENIFDKKPAVSKRKSSNCVNIVIYQKKISKRLDIPADDKLKKVLKLPNWIFRNKGYLIRYLRGLYEAEGSFSSHLPTYTHKFIFSNRNQSLLGNVFIGLKKLGFNPHRDAIRVQISRREEVYKCMELLNFRKY